MQLQTLSLSARHDLRVTGHVRHTVSPFDSQSYHAKVALVARFQFSFFNYAYTKVQSVKFQFSFSNYANIKVQSVKFQFSFFNYANTKVQSVPYFSLSLRKTNQTTIHIWVNTCNLSSKYYYCIPPFRSHKFHYRIYVQNSFYLVV